MSVVPSRLAGSGDGDGLSLDRPVLAGQRPVEAAPGRDRPGVAYAVLLLLGVLDAAAYSIIAPVAPTIAARTGAGPALIGVLVAAFPLGIVVGFVLAGRAVAGGRHSLLLLVSLGTLAAGSLAFVVGDGLPAYLLARAVMGLGSGGLWMGITFSTLDRWPGQEYLCMSRIFAAYSVGGLLGPALGALGGVEGPFLAYLVLVGAGALLVPAMGRSPHGRRFGSDRSVLRLPAFRVAAAGILFAVMALGVVEGVLPLHFAAALTQGQIGLLYAGVALVVAAAAGFASRLRPLAALVGATGLVVAGLGVAAATGVVGAWVVGLVVGGIGIGLANTGSIGVLLDGVPTDRSVTAIVVWSQLGILGYLLGPLVGGTAAEALGFAVLGIVLLVPAVVVVVLARGLRRGAAAGPG